MKSIIISIQPQWVAKILNGEKTIEVRKTAPQAPFKAYVYCTQGEELWGDGTGATWKGIDEGQDMDEAREATPTLSHLNGKVVAEFVCDKVDSYTMEYYKYEDVYKDIRKNIIDDDGDEQEIYETSNDEVDPNNCKLLKRACLTFDELGKYCGEGFTDFSALHITELKVYDEPKELGEFRKPCGDCLGKCTGEDYSRCAWQTVTRPPQSWQYCEELD